MLPERCPECQAAILGCWLSSAVGRRPSAMRRPKSGIQKRSGIGYGRDTLAVARVANGRHEAGARHRQAGPELAWLNRSGRFRSRTFGPRRHTARRRKVPAWLTGAAWWAGRARRPGGGHHMVYATRIPDFRLARSVTEQTWTHWSLTRTASAGLASPKRVGCQPSVLQVRGPA